MLRHDIFGFGPVWPTNVPTDFGRVPTNVPTDFGSVPVDVFTLK